MRLTTATIASALLAFSSTAVAKSQFSGDPWIIDYISTKLAVASGTLSPSEDGLNTTAPSTNFFTVDLRDPDPLTNATAVCSGEWAANSTAPTTWQKCDDDYFNWKFESWKSVSEYTLDVKHAFKDPSVGEPPQDFVITFAKNNFVKPANLTCYSGEKGARECVGKKDLDLTLLVYAAVA